MTLNELLESVRRVEVRTSRLVNEFTRRGGLGIPTGFRLKAQGCDMGATLGQCPADLANRNAVAAIPFVTGTREICRNPVGVVSKLPSGTQGSFATLGWRTQSRWDCRIRRSLPMGFRQKLRIVAANRNSNPIEFAIINPSNSMGLKREGIAC